MDCLPDGSMELKHTAQQQSDRSSWMSKKWKISITSRVSEWEGGRKTLNMFVHVFSKYQIATEKNNRKFEWW